MHETEGAQDPTSVMRRYRSLLEIADSISLHETLPELLQDLALRLRQAVGFDFIHLALYDRDGSVVRQHCVTHDGAASACDLPISAAASDEVFRTQRPHILPNLTGGDGSRNIESSLDGTVRSIAVFPLKTARTPVGTLAFLRREGGAYDEPDCQFLLRIAELLAVSVEGMLAGQKATEYRQELAAHADRGRLLLEINKLLFSELDTQVLFAAICRCLHRLIKHDYAFLLLQETATDFFRLHAMESPSGKELFETVRIFPRDTSSSALVLRTRRPLLMGRDDLGKLSGELCSRAYEQGVYSMCWVPLLVGDRGIGTIGIASLQPAAFSAEDAELLSQVAGQIAIALENSFAFEQASQLIDKLEQEKIYLEKEVDSSYRSEIIGHSEGLGAVLEQVRTVAPTDATVLVLGETGTGKELIARAIHRLSRRKDNPFVKVNCSAIPTGLLESELFGHEKGAFTGAIQQKCGRLELVHKGTLFLDEVGDIPLELQPKLLRVLQDQEFERLGSNQTVQVDVRIIAATHRNLEAMVESGGFRGDLFYRLHVFPIHLPSLRERKEDLPLLVRHFAKKFARRMDRRIGTIPASSIAVLQRWHWPGNVRELENLIERAVILSSNGTLNIPLPQLEKHAAEDSSPPPVDTLAEADKAHILHVLRETRGIISGPNGAAARLGLKRTTLNYKMKKLGIDPHSF